MEDNQTQLQNYIQQQLRSGQTPDEIDASLRAAGWTPEPIQAAFTAIQQQMMPTSLTPAQTTETPQANGKTRGRIRTGWQLFKQSWTVLMGNRYLLRYLLMTGLWVFGITIVFVVIYWVFDRSLYQNDYNDNFKPLGYVLAFLDYVITYFFINLYAAGLTANVLDIFEGKRQGYKDYMHIAWSKAPTILAYSTIEAIVGMFLRYVVERIRWVGWILAWLLGTLWSLGTLFVVPIIVTSERPRSVASIKQSMRFFKQTWGESVTTKVTVNLPLALMNLALLGLFVIAFFAMASAGILNFATFLILFFAFFIIILTLAIIGSFANSLVNIALYYFATYHKIPPAFSAELLNQVFIKRKKRRLFGRGQNQQTAA